MAKNYPERSNKLPCNKLAMQERTSITPTNDGDKKIRRKEKIQTTQPQWKRRSSKSFMYEEKKRQRRRGIAVRKQPDKPGQLRTKVYTSRVV
jgi:hypothetical protein